MSFQELLAQLGKEQEQSEALAKSVPAKGGKDDEAIQAAAAEAGDTDADDENPEDHEEPDGDEGKEPMAKSMQGPDGEEYVDATDMLKSMQAKLDEHDSVLAKAITGTLDVVKSLRATVVAQDAMLKSMNARLDKLAGTGAGRKSTLAVLEKPAAGETVAKSQNAGLTPADLMAKANAAFDAGKISGQELTVIDVSLRQGVAPNPALLAKALA